MNLRRFAVIAVTSAVCGTSSLYAQSLIFSGNSLKAIEISPEKSTGLEKIYVLYSLDGVTASYTSTSGKAVKWSVFSNLGGGYAEEIPSTQDGNKSSVSSLHGDSGYIIQDGDRQYCFWIVEYLPHRLELKSVQLADDQECDATLLHVEGSGEAIHYFTINGAQKTLDREIKVEYSTQKWSSGSFNYEDTSVSSSFASLTETLRLSPPNYCASSFTVSGDRFLKAWNWEETVESTTFQPHSVDAMTEAVQQSQGSDTDDNTVGSNQIGANDGDGLGGSAPCEISFLAYVTDGVIHNEWQLSRDPEFENIDYRFTQQDLDYTFLDQGTYYVRYIGSNSDGSCEYISDTYEISIGESRLLIPNAFSPNGDGVNDEWKVSYRSLIEFRCWIFDRNGHQVCQLTSPDQGWDGRIGGKTVDTGVFYYVIEAVGADGKKYKKSGDINVIKYVGNKGTSATPEE